MATPARALCRSLALVAPLVAQPNWVKVTSIGQRDFASAAYDSARG